MEQLLINETTAETIAEHHFGKKPKKITQFTTGLSNFVYEVNMGSLGKFIIRICDIPHKMQFYMKEQWAVAQAKERGVPAPEILEVGNEIVAMPYMVVKKVEGRIASEHPNRIKILQQMGKFSAVINTIPTSGFGHVFDWSNNTLSKRETWKDYLEKEVNLLERFKIFEDNGIFTKENYKKLQQAVKDMEGWDKSPNLNHCDMRLKNILVDEEGKIAAILDWENCMSNIAPFWELSIALHDLTIDEKQSFLEGYGIREKDYREMSQGIKTINLINYAPAIASMAERKDLKMMEWYKVRLNGALDLYSL